MLAKEDNPERKQVKHIGLAGKKNNKHQINDHHKQYKHIPWQKIIKDKEWMEFAPYVIAWERPL